MGAYPCKCMRYPLVVFRFIPFMYLYLGVAPFVAVWGFALSFRANALVAYAFLALLVPLVVYGVVWYVVTETRKRRYLRNRRNRPPLASQ